MNVNRIKLSGMVLSNPNFFKSRNGERIYSVDMASIRCSGIVDTITCLIPEELVTRFYAGCNIGVYGSVQTYNHPDNIERIGKKNLIAVNVTSTYAWHDADENFMRLTGTISKPVVTRETLSGKLIADIIIEHSFEYNSSHLQCIAWFDNALMAAELPVGTKVLCLGRLQSRVYEKVTDNRIREITTHEVCVTKISYLTKKGAKR